MFFAMILDNVYYDNEKLRFRETGLFTYKVRQANSLRIKVIQHINESHDIPFLQFDRRADCRPRAVTFDYIKPWICSEVICKKEPCLALTFTRYRNNQTISLSKNVESNIYCENDFQFIETHKNLFLAKKGDKLSSTLVLKGTLVSRRTFNGLSLLKWRMKCFINISKFPNNISRLGGREKT